MADQPPPKPARIEIDPAAIPQPLKDANRWLCWQWELKKDWQKRDRKHYDKPPYIASTSGPQVHGSSTNSTAWRSFDEAYAAYASGRFDGLGFALGKDKDSDLHFSGMDLDECIVDGKVAPWAMYLAGRLDSYTEYSPSGLGLKVFTYGALPKGCDKKKDGRNIEFYDGGRYFTVTGQHYQKSHREIQERIEELAAINAEVYPKPQPVRRRMEDREVALSALAAISNKATDYEEWLRVGMALHSVDDGLLDAWDEWSRQCLDKYVPGACEKKWVSFKRGGIGIGSLIFWAKAEGWQDPRQSDGPVENNGQKSNGVAGHRRFDDLLLEDDVHMGDGLTEEDGAGPWHLIMQMGNPRRFLLRSPIWRDSPYLKNGYLVLTDKDIHSWPKIRQKALVQAGVYVKPDDSRNPVWDGIGGRHLLQYLIENAKHVEPSTDYDRILAAAEYILDRAERLTPLAEDAQATARPKDLLRLEDGTVLFKIRGLASSAAKDAPGITFDDLREAASEYGTEQRPRIGGKRRRYLAFTPAHVRRIEESITRRGPLLHEETTT